MKNFKRIISSMLVILELLLSLFIPSYAASSSSQPASYSSEYNSGTRDVVCTTLDGTSASSYYQGYEYEDLSALSSSALFTKLQTLMRTTHTYTSSYDDCHYKADRTDCENGDGRVSLIYTSYSATMSQWNGWNREHVWPQSLGGGNTTGGGADLHHVRPSDSGVNSSRGNKPYGESGSGATSKYGTDPAVGVLGGTYNSTYFEPLDNVKGDVARICLYVYVRWNANWGATDITDVFQSVDVLLEWCELDPVDTWEMGRNEVVEDIQGNRNVFIDYPEYAWLLFDREVPDDMVTPSGEAMGESSSGGNTEPPVCQHANTTTTDTATCVAAGIKTVECKECGVVVSSVASVAKGHSYVNGVCSVCYLSQGGSSGGSADGYSGTYYISTKRTSGNYWYMSNNLGTASTKRYQAIDTGLSTLPDSISEADANTAYLFTLVKNSDGTYKIYANGTSGTNNYLGWSSGNSGTLVAESSAKNVTVDYDSSKDTFSIHFTSGSETRYLSLNGTSGNNYFAWYKSGQKSDLTLIPVLSAQCTHTDTTVIDTATCTAAGTKTVTCNTCGEVLSSEASSAKGHTSGAAASCESAQSCTVCKVVIVAALGHNYANGVCTRCNEQDPNACNHVSTTVTDSATCTAAGTKTVTCNTCGKVLSSETSKAKGHTPGAAASCESAQSCTVCKVVITAALGHDYVDGVCSVCKDKLPTVIFSVNGVVIDKDYGTTVTLPGEPNLPSVNYKQEYTFIGWATTTQNNVEVKPNVLAAGTAVTITEDTTYYAVYSYSESDGSTSDGWVKKDIGEISSTDIVVVTMSNGSKVYALSNDKGTSAAPTAVVVTVNNNALEGGIADNLKWNIVNNGGSLTFYVDGTTSEWLYCTSTNNGVRVGTNSAKEFTIDSSSGYLKHTGTNRYIGVYTTNPDWRCYTSINSNITGQTLAFYVFERGSISYYTTTLECDTQFTGASLYAGTDLAIRYHAILGGNPEDFTVRFTMNGKVTIANGEYDESTGKYVFSFCGIAPQCMGDTVVAELLLNGEVVDTKEAYSVKQYVIDAFELYPNDAELKRLLSDMLYYGAAAQLYRGYKTDALVTDSVTGLLDPTEDAPTEKQKNINTTDNSNVRFTAAGVNFDYINRIYVKIETADVNNVAIKVNGVELVIESSGENEYIAYSNGISALEFDSAVEFTLTYNGEAAQTLTYSVNDYVLAMAGDAEIGDLALALYRYGASAKVYAN